MELTLAHQHFASDDDVRHAVLGNADSLISFQLGPKDASLLTRFIQPTFDVFDLLNLPNHSFYLKPMIDRALARVSSACLKARYP